MNILTQAFGRGALAVLLLLLLCAPATAAEYYVDQNHPNASDQNDGSEQRPWLTMYRAAQGPLRPGDTVYVKAGRYDVSTGGTWSSPAIQPNASGEPGKPITFKSLPRHAAILDNGGRTGNPAIGVHRRSHVVIDGFVIPNAGDRAIAVFGGAGAPVRDIVIQNNLIHGLSLGGLGNAEAIRLEHAEDVIVRNNEIHNIYNGSRTTNASAVKTYFTHNLLMENNEIYDLVAGFKEKEGSSNIVIRRNHFHGCTVGVVLNNQNSAYTQNVRVRENIFECGRGLESATVATAGMREIYIYNNTFVGYRQTAVHGTRHGESLYVWNNIFYRPDADVGHGDFFTYRTDLSEIRRLDYNLFFREPKIVVGLYATNETFLTLGSWQRSRYGLSANDTLTDPGFVDAAKRDFRLRPDSPARNAGRVEGVSSGARVNLGAYTTGSELIGLLPEGGNSPPQAPTNLRVK
jgi:hypothetical protein